MSGSSLDGLDIAYVQFREENDHWQYEVIAAECLPYPPPMRSKLTKARSLSVTEFCLMHTQLGHFFGNAVAEFLRTKKLNKPDLIASHGHTVFHDPENMATCQIGDGASIAQISAVLTVCDLRSSDIAAGGQGAPIVPMGEQYLFPEPKYLLNIGGIVNITKRESNGDVVAFDIAVANQVLNYLSEKEGKAYDEDGKMAAEGRLDNKLLAQLEALPYYQLQAPKSLDNGFTAKYILPLMQQANLSNRDALATYVEHIAMQISKVIIKEGDKQSALFISGGGALNSFLVQKIEEHLNGKAYLQIPDRNTILYKEAIIMAFLGLLRWQGKVNVLKSVTGARKDTINGAIYHP